MTEHRLEVADVFRQHEQEFFAAWGHTVSRQQRRVFRDICACRTAALGSHLKRCQSCGYETTSFNSCRSRHCPKCQSTARDKWLAGQARHLLPVSYCHVVFTLPHELAPVALQNPKLVYDLLFRATRDALLTIAADPKRLGARVGFLAVLHTWDQRSCITRTCTASSPPAACLSTALDGCIAASATSCPRACWARDFGIVS